MDLSIADSVSEGVGTLSRHTAGGRLRFATDSSVFQLTVDYDFLWLMSHMPLTGSSGFSLFEETENGEVFIKNLSQNYNFSILFVIFAKELQKQMLK